MKEADRNDWKRRAPEAELGSATTRFGDGARSFLGCDRTRQLVPSRKPGRARIAGRATAAAVDCAKKTFLNSEPAGKEKDQDRF